MQHDESEDRPAGAGIDRRDLMKAIGLGSLSLLPSGTADPPTPSTRAVPVAELR